MPSRRKSSAIQRGASLFSALPAALKRTIRQQAFDAGPSEEGGGTASTNLIATQPDDQGKLNRTASRDDGQEANKRVKIVGVDKGKGRAVVDESASIDAEEVLANGVINVGAGHSWNCTGLVPRYDHWEEVPNEIKKCESQATDDADLHFS